MKTELQYSTNVHSERSTPPDAKPVLPAVASTVVYLEDCVQALKRFDDNYFDVAIVDPPYGLNISNSEYLGNDKNDKRWAGRANGYRHTKKDWDKNTPTAEYWEQLFRVSKNQIVWGGNYFTNFLPESRGWAIVTGKQIGRAHG